MTSSVGKTFKVVSFKPKLHNSVKLVSIEIQDNRKLSQYPGIDSFFFIVKIDQIDALIKLLEEDYSETQNILSVGAWTKYDIYWNSSDTVHIQRVGHEPQRIIELSRTTAKELASAIDTAIEGNSATIFGRS